MFAETLESLRIAFELLAYSAIAYISIALLVKGRDAVTAARRAASEIRLNLSWYVLDAVFVAPVIGVVAILIRTGVDRYSLAVLSPETWTGLPTWLTFFAVVFLGDFISYWRHRLEHTRLLWPTHAIHHSDTQMSWLTLARFHPLNRLVTGAVDIGCLAILGLPAWALVANQIIRHYYGELIHADLPWTYGPAKRLFVSPVMHQWHHARDVVGSGSNFATVFSVFDQAFGTYYVPGLCTVPLGVNDDIGVGLTRQLVYPFTSWFGRRQRRRRRVPAPPDLTPT